MNLNRIFPRAVIAGALLVAVLSLAVGPDTIHGFAENSLGMGPAFTQPIINF